MCLAIDILDKREAVGEREQNGDDTEKLIACGGAT